MEGIEERWRDTCLWLLAGLSKIIDLRSFYYHLREECNADLDRIRRVKHRLRQMRRQILQLQDHLKYCSPLGPFLRSLRRTHVRNGDMAPGIQTIRRLEGAGIRTLTEIATLEIQDLMALGIQRSLALQIHAYANRFE